MRPVTQTYSISKESSFRTMLYAFLWRQKANYAKVSCHEAKISHTCHLARFWKISDSNPPCEFHGFSEFFQVIAQTVTWKQNSKGGICTWVHTAFTSVAWILAFWVLLSVITVLINMLTLLVKSYGSNLIRFKTNFIQNYSLEFVSNM
jgi:hypothetical protein